MISEHDRVLFEHIKNGIMAEGKHEAKKKNYVRKTELLWSGDHYLLVRTGPKADVDRVVRKVILWSREYLLLDRGDRRDNAMLTIALAAIDPVNHDWRENRCRLLHTTDPFSGCERWRGKKLSKGVLAEIIEFSKEEDRTFFEREAAQSGKFVAANTFSQRMVKFVENAGFHVSGCVEKLGVERPAGERYQTPVEGTALGSGSQRIDFTPTSSNEVEVDVQNLSLNSTEFEILIEALGKIKKLKQERSPLFIPTPKEEEAPT